MKHQIAFRKLNRTSSHRRAMLRNMCEQLIMHGRITTTLQRVLFKPTHFRDPQKAKELRRVTDKIITLGKKGELHHRRKAAAFLRSKESVRKVFGQYAPQFADREGGYTRVIRQGRRLGDDAQMAFIELVPETVEESRQQRAIKHLTKIERRAFDETFRNACKEGKSYEEAEGEARIVAKRAGDAYYEAAKDQFPLGIPFKDAASRVQ